LLQLGYHTSHDSVSVVKTTFKVYGKRQTLTLSQPKTPEPIVTKFEWCDYVVDAYHQKIGLNSPRGFCSPYRWNIHPSCSKFISRHFFGAWTRLQASPLDRFLRLYFFVFSFVYLLSVFFLTNKVV